VSTLLLIVGAILLAFEFFLAGISFAGMLDEEDASWKLFGLSLLAAPGLVYVVIGLWWRERSYW
jgi:membrane protein DedA with SNARE-associated domain